mmetsp:Transcript_43004/g.132899  ORF Transcript_43004/g.132899 Transcript_43004/m.132899 type:complete len:207 (+) Transcript_43004:283-903(+)
MSRFHSYHARAAVAQPTRITARLATHTPTNLSVGSVPGEPRWSRCRTKLPGCLVLPLWKRGYSMPGAPGDGLRLHHAAAPTPRPVVAKRRGATSRPPFRWRAAQLIDFTDRAPAVRMLPHRPPTSFPAFPANARKPCVLFTMNVTNCHPRQPKSRLPTTAVATAVACSGKCSTPSRQLCEVASCVCSSTCFADRLHTSQSYTASAW